MYESVTQTHTEVLEELSFLRAASGPVIIRLGIAASAADRCVPEVHYLVTTGFFKLLHDLDVTAFRHSYHREGLTFYIEADNPKSEVQEYLHGLKRWHILGHVWDFSLIEGMYLHRITVDSRRTEASATAEELQQLCRMHMRMGSRPLRFSRYVLYAGLAPFGRKRSYGSCCMRCEDVRGEQYFSQALQGLDILTRSYRNIDFSSASSLEELRAIGKPIQDALDRVGAKQGTFKGLLFHTLFLAAAYEQKTPVRDIEKKISQLAFGIEKDFLRPETPEGNRLLHSRGICGARLMAMAGYQPILEKSIPFWRASHDFDDLTLFLLTQIFDTTTLRNTSLERYEYLQRLARRALTEGDINRDALDRQFTEEGLVTDACRDLISVTLLLDLILEEEN
ncbi:MAG: triphosphoribosyl-dephospho-CoA synthase [Ndongobacter sp.]|nr:triphosphoribosyl-dephospho-CoA synthase [Ndongobacter sp.]